MRDFANYVCSSKQKETNTDFILNPKKMKLHGRFAIARLLINPYTNAKRIYCTLETLKAKGILKTLWLLKRCELELKKGESRGDISTFARVQGYSLSKLDGI